MTAEQVSFLMDLSQAAFERIVISESKGDAGAPITQALCSDLDLAERWVAALTKMVARNRELLEIEEINHKRGERWEVSTRRFLQKVEERRADAVETANRLYRAHRVHELEAVVREVFDMLDSCPHNHDIDLTGQQWAIVDSIVGART